MIKVSGEVACFHLYHNGVVANIERHGVAIALSEAAQVVLLAWGPVSPRLAIFRIRGAMVNLTDILLYAPEFDAEKEARYSRRFMMTGSVDHRIC